MTTRIIASCTDKEMRIKLLEMKPSVENKPSVEELDKVVADFEARKISEDLLKGDGNRNRRVQRDREQSKPKGECWKCRQKGHFSRECTFPKDKLKCTICNTTGKHNTFEECEGPKKYPTKEKKTKKKVKSRRSHLTPGPDGEGSATESENEDSEQEGRSRRVDARRVVARSARKAVARRIVARSADNQPTRVRRVNAKCSRQQGIVSHPTPPIGIGVRNSRSQRTRAKIYAILDTGCTATIINSKVAAQCKLKVDKNVDINLSDAAGKRMKTHGMTSMFIKAIDGTTKKIEAIVSPDLTDPCLVSWSDLIRLQYLPKEWPNIKPRVRRTSTQQEGPLGDEVPAVTEEDEEDPGYDEKAWPPEEWGKEITDVIKEFLHLFKNKLDVDSRIKAPPMDITFKENATLPQCTSCRPIPIHLRGMADEFVKDALKAGCMEKTIEGEACSPAHFVEKYDAEGNLVGVRLVCDLKKLNDSVKRSAITFPTGNDIWNSVEPGSQRFFKMDLTSGYHQVELSQEASSKLQPLL